MAFNAAPARELSEAHMTQSCGLLRATRRKDSAGHMVDEGYAPFLTTPCRLRQATAKEEVIAGQLSEQVEAVVCMPAGTPVDNEQRVKLDGVEYEISGVVPQSPDFKASEKVMVRRR